MKIDWDELIIIFAIWFAYSLILFNLFSSWQSLNSPLLGGDYFFQMGSIRHILSSPPSEWFKSSSILGEIPTYSTIYAIIVAEYAKLTGQYLIYSMFSINYLFVLLAIITLYFLFKNIFDNKWIAMFGILLFLPFTSLPIMKYTEFAWAFAVPLFLLGLWYFYKEQSLKMALIVGLLYGFIALLHPTCLIIGGALIGFFGLYMTLKDKLPVSEAFRTKFVYFFIAGILGIAISLLWWAYPLSHLGSLGSGQVNVWGFYDLSRLDIQFTFLLQTLMDYFINFSSVTFALISLLACAGLFWIIKSEKTESSIFIILLLVASALLTFHYFLTVPLMNTFFAPNYMNLMLLHLAIIILCCFAIKHLFVFLNNINKIYSQISAMIILAVLILGAYLSYDGWYNYQWFKVARNPISENYLELSNYLLANTSYNDVILSTNELSFVINAMSGRKVLAFRRGHVSPFYEFDSREIATAIILYGNNTEVKKQLIQKYNVTYLYIDSYWIESEWHIDYSTNKVVGKYDPLLVFDTPENRKALSDNGVDYYATNDWVDPSMSDNLHRKMDILLVTPNNYRNSRYLWASDLNDYLKEVWRSSDNSSYLFKVDLTGKCIIDDTGATMCKI
jgi:hypothetical protein